MTGEPSLRRYSLPSRSNKVTFTVGLLLEQERDKAEEQSMNGSVASEEEVTKDVGCGPALAVDLDGTLCRTDTLHEALTRLLVEQWHSVPSLLAALARDKQTFKSYVADRVVPAPESLRYNDAVLDAIQEARAAGRKVVLVSASDRRIVEAVATHLDCFDEQIGTGSEGTDGVNLGGEAKATFLRERYGEEGFDYIGDCATDMPVWRSARYAFCVQPAPALVRKAHEVGVELLPVGREPTVKARWKPFVRALRPHQWSKNALVFLPLIAAQDFSRFWLALLAFVLFSMTASAVYVLNDLVDIPSDRMHKRKRDRPFAAGEIPISWGIVMAFSLLVTSMLAAVFLMPPIFLAALAFYFAATLLYSFSLKRKLIVDVVTLAGLYTMRIIAGSAAAGVVPSMWLLAFSMFLFYALAAIKRQAELEDQLARGKAESPGRAYLSSDLIVMQIIAISSGHAAVLVFALYLYSPSVAALYTKPEILWLICPLLLYWLGRISILTHRGYMTDDPIVFAARDKISLATAGVIAIILMLAEHVG